MVASSKREVYQYHERNAVMMSINISSKEKSRKVSMSISERDIPICLEDGGAGQGLLRYDGLMRLHIKSYYGLTSGDYCPKVRHLKR